MFVLIVCLSLLSSSYATDTTTTTDATTTTVEGTTVTGETTTTVEGTTVTGGSSTTGETTTSSGVTTTSGGAMSSTQATTTVATGACVDVIPATDAHNCAYYAGLNLCNNVNYFDLMGQQCPATCNRCAPATAPPPAGCADKLNPNTGVSDCPSRAYLCTNQVYYALMTDQCPVTCNRCTVAPSPPAAPTCVDKVNPSTGVSDCPRQAALCNDANYYSLMTTQCPKTCNRCSGTSTGTGTTTCADKTAADGTSNCAQMKSYCNNATYKALMSQQCAKTCGLC